MDIFLSFEPTRYDMWYERRTFHLHCGIMILEISLPRGLRSRKPTRHQQQSRQTSVDERKTTGARP